MKISLLSLVAISITLCATPDARAQNGRTMNIKVSPLIPVADQIAEAQAECQYRLYGKKRTLNLGADGGILYARILNRSAGSALPKSTFGPGFSLSGGVRWRVWNRNCRYRGAGAVAGEHRIEMPRSWNIATYVTLSASYAQIAGFSGEDDDTSIVARPFFGLVTVDFESTDFDSPSQGSTQTTFFFGVGVGYTPAKTTIKLQRLSPMGTPIASDEKARFFGLLLRFGLRV